MKLASFVFLITLSLAAKATTWVESEVDDPILEGEKCSVGEPASYGGYIYNWPSKYDQVFWPHTALNGIWFCEKSGFTALIGDFSELSATEITTIKKYLLKNPPQDSSTLTKLLLLEKIYSFRNTDKAFKNRLLRVLARWYQNLDDIDKANTYRNEAFLAIQTQLKGTLDEYQRLEYLYLAANYSKQFGDQTASDQYIKELVSLIKTIKSENSKGFAEYLQELHLDTKHIKEGGVLDPELPE